MPRCWPAPGASLALLLLLAPGAGADFMFPAGNWTHSTNLFSALHFVPGYNEAGEWDLLTGGNWTATNHSDANLVGDAAAYLCPCPQPPCETSAGPPKPGYNTSVFACLSEALNMSHAVCTTFHRDRTNVTCVTPTHAVVCDVPAFTPNATLLNWWENDDVPSRSYYSADTLAVSCIVRGMAEEDMGPYDHFLDTQVLHDALARETCEVVCTATCQTICTTRHVSVNELFPSIDAWRYDSAIDDNPRDFEVNGTLYQERQPAQYMRGVTADNFGQEREVLNLTCTLPTLSAGRHMQV